MKSSGYGTANLEWEGRASVETVYEIASITKVFTAVAAMMLLQDGALDLDASNSRYLNDVPETYAGIRPRHLLTHTAGLPVAHYDSRKLYAQPLVLEPGTAHEYGKSAMFLRGVEFVDSDGPMGGPLDFLSLTPQANSARPRAA